MWDNRGTTIVEMLVCFVLLGILMVAASQFLTSSMRTYSSAKRGLAGREAADLVADHIEGLLESSTIKKALQPFTEENKQITFWDREKRKAVICCDEDGYLDVVYANGKDVSVHWKFDPGVYRGYRIKSMRFLLTKPETPKAGDTEEYLDPSVYDPKTVKLELVVESAQNGEYAIDRYIRFGNVK